jgi:hypothetical protein
MNRLTAIGLASLVAYGLLIASKYTGMVSAAPEELTSRLALATGGAEGDSSAVQPLGDVARQPTLQMPAPVARIEPSRPSAAALEFRTSRDLKAFVDGMASRRSSLSSDERYFLARALEECQFTTTINEDLAAYSAKKKREFLAGLTPGDAVNPKRVAAYEAVDNTQRCMGFQNVKISPKDIEDLYQAAAQQGDPRAQARILTNDMGKNNSGRADPAMQNARSSVGNEDEVSRLIGLLEQRDPEATIIVGEYLARQSSLLRVGPDQREVPEPAALLGAFSLVACDMGQDCSSGHREPLQACAYAGYCNAQSFEELYQSFLASPWAYTQAIRYRAMIHTAITTQNWALIGLVPQSSPAPQPAPQGR